MSPTETTEYKLTPPMVGPGAWELNMKAKPGQGLSLLYVLPTPKEGEAEG